MKKVNLLFYGQPRGFHRGEPYQSIQREIIDKYPNVTVFGHMWFSKESEYDISTWVKNKPYIDPDSPSKFMHLYDPETLWIEKPRKFEFVNTDIMPALKERFGENQYFSETNVSNILSQMNSIGKVSELAYDYRSYDNDNIYILTRYDGVITGIPDLNTLPLMKNDKHILYIPQRGSDFNDLIWIFSDFTLWPLLYMQRMPYMDINNLDYIKTNPTPEEFKKFWYINYCSDNHVIEKIDIYSEVVRN